LSLPNYRAERDQVCPNFQMLSLSLSLSLDIVDLDDQEISKRTARTRNNNLPAREVDSLAWVCIEERQLIRSRRE